MRLVDAVGMEREDKPRKAAGMTMEDTPMETGRHTWMFDMLHCWVGKKEREMKMHRVYEDEGRL